MIVARPGQNGAVLVRGSNIQLLAAGISTRARTLGRHLQDGEKINSVANAVVATGKRLMVFQGGV